MAKWEPLKTHPSQKPWKKLAKKMIRIHFFRTLEISQRPAAIWGMFIPEKGLNLDRNSILWGFDCPVPSLARQLRSSLEHQRPMFPIPEEPEGAEGLQSLVLQEPATSDTAAGSLEPPLEKFSLFDLTQSSLPAKSLSLGGHLLKIFTNKCFSVAVA